MKTGPSFSSQPCAFRAQIVLTTFSSSLLCTSPEKKKQAPSYVQSFLKTSNQLALPQDNNRNENSAWQKRRARIFNIQSPGRKKRASIPLPEIQCYASRPKTSKWETKHDDEGKAKDARQMHIGGTPSPPGPSPTLPFLACSLQCPRPSGA